MMRIAIATIVASAITAAASQPTFRASVDAVRIDVSVMNGLSPVAGLTRDNFIVTDDGVPQTIETVQLENLALSLTLVLDTSGSMEGDRLDNLISASQTLIKALHPGDEAALLTFSEPVQPAVAMTRDRAKMLAAIGGLTASGMTALNDAVFLGLQLKPPSPGDSTPVMLVFSDGHDTASWLRNDQLLEATRRSSMLLHVVELMAPSYSVAANAQRPSAFLDELAKAGGGRHWSAQRSAELRDLFGKALNELRARYLLTYSPSSSREGWHDVKVTLKNARGDVTARPGYFVAAK